MDSSRRTNEAAPMREHRSGGAETATRAVFVSDCQYSTSAGAVQYPQHGEIDGLTWRKTAHSSKHLLRKPSAWCLDVQDLAAAQECGALFCEIADADSGNVYRASFRILRERGFLLERGHGQQIALVLAAWQCFRPEEVRAQEAKDAARAKAQIARARAILQQKGLWEGGE